MSTAASDGRARRGPSRRAGAVCCPPCSTPTHVMTSTKRFRPHRPCRARAAPVRRRVRPVGSGRNLPRAAVQARRMGASICAALRRPPAARLSRPAHVDADSRATRRAPRIAHPTLTTILWRSSEAGVRPRLAWARCIRGSGTPSSSNLPAREPARSAADLQRVLPPARPMCTRPGPDESPIPCFAYHPG